MGTDPREAYEQVTRMLAAIPGKETFTVYDLEPLLTAALGLHHESRASPHLFLWIRAYLAERRTIAQHVKFMEELGLIRCVKKRPLRGSVYVLTRKHVLVARK